MAGVWLCAAALALLLLCEWRGARAGAALAKALASFAFLLAAWHFGAMESGYGRWIAAGLLLCAAGDLLLIPRESAACFRAGIAAFLLGHVAYAAAFLGAQPDLRALLVAAPCAAAFAALVWRWLAPHVSRDFRLPVRLYVGVISLMLACAVGAALGGGPPAAAAGAAGFAASDLAVARERFVAHAFANRLWGLPLYYASQLVLAATTSPSAHYS